MSFRASYDTTTKIISAAVFVLFLAIAVDTKSVIAEGIFAVLFAAAYAWSPSGYCISDGDVVVKRLIGNVRIPLNSIRNVRVATADDLNASLRVFGSGGLFGYYGLFRNLKLGKSTWYVTDRSHAVVLDSDSGTALLSPDDVGGFMAWMRKPATAPTPLPHAHPTGSAGWLKAAIPMAIGGLAAVFAVAGLLYSPGPPSYTLTAESLTIHDKFYPATVNAANVDVENIRTIDFNKDTEWQPVLRTNGFGNARYHSGWFQIASGKVVRMYRAHSTRLVLLPPKNGETAVLLEAREPARLVAELQRKWGG